MKTIDVRIESLINRSELVADIRYALHRTFPHHFAVTELPPPRGEDENKCEWRWDTDGFWHTNCGGSFTLNTGDLKQNEFNYCHKCGRKIYEMYPVEPAAPGAPAVDIKEQAKREIEAIDKSTPGWEKEGICAACNKPVNFKDGFIWNGKLNIPVHYGCSDVAPAVDEQQYRILGPNEIIQEGDEYLNQFCGWIKTGDAFRHITPNEEGMKYRRKIAPVAPAVKWDCPYCGEKNEIQNEYCHGCREAKPNLLRCPSCEKLRAENAALKGTDEGGVP